MTEHLHHLRTAVVLCLHFYSFIMNNKVLVDLNIPPSILLVSRL